MERAGLEAKLCFKLTRTCSGTPAATPWPTITRIDQRNTCGGAPSALGGNIKPLAVTRVDVVSA